MSNALRSTVLIVKMIVAGPIVAYAGLCFIMWDLVDLRTIDPWWRFEFILICFLFSWIFYGRQWLKIRSERGDI